MQKEKLKTQKGITLIALIITIIVMLILVVVTVNVTLKGGLFKTAKDAADETKQAVKNEMGMLQYEYEIASAKGETTAENFTEYVLDTKYSGLEIGDYVNYDELSNDKKIYTPDSSKGAGISGTKNDNTGKYDVTTGEFTTEDLGWRVLGISNDGELELISNNPTSKALYLANDEGYLYGIDILNNMCNELYGKGRYATSARSLNVNDINKITEYDPTTINGYGDLYQFRFPEGGTVIEYRKSVDGGNTWTDWSVPGSDTKFKSLRMPGDNSILNSSNPGVSEILKSVNYGNRQLISSSKTDMFIYSTTSVPIDYWLASTAISCNNGGYVTFSIYALETSGPWAGNNGGREGAVMNQALYGTNESYYLEYHFIRPVVTLNSEVTITKDATNDGSTVSKACLIGLK